MGYVGDLLPWMLSRFYAEAAFSPRGRDLGNQIITDIRQVYLEKLKSAQWMNDSVKSAAMDKVNKMVQKIGYPVAVSSTSTPPLSLCVPGGPLTRKQSPNILDPQELQDDAAGVNVSSSFFDTFLSSLKAGSSVEWAALAKPRNRAAWGMPVFEVNAYYDPSGNEIVFPAGIMQFPFFDADLPSYVNYGGFGAVAGHETSHAFDTSGSLYDADGMLRNWWDNDTRAEFDKRATCFVNEFNNFTTPGPNGTTLHINGQQTLNENIADTGGLSAAWAAWQQRRKNATTPEPSLRGSASSPRSRCSTYPTAVCGAPSTRPKPCAARCRGTRTPPTCSASSAPPCTTRGASGRPSSVRRSSQSASFGDEGGGGVSTREAGGGKGGRPGGGHFSSVSYLWLVLT